jgi:hypothetical protein
MSDRKAKTLADPGFYYLGVLVDVDGNRVDDSEVDAVYIDSTLKSKYARTMWSESQWSSLNWNCSALRKNVGLRKAKPSKGLELCWLPFKTIEELNSFAGTNFTKAPNEGV